MRKICYSCSEKLAQERGAFNHYKETANNEKSYDYNPRRNAVLLAIAPTATISIISGTTSSIDSYFSNLYSRDTLSGKHVIINSQLIEELEAKEVWNEEIANLIKQHNGSVQPIKKLDDIIDKAKYKTAYEIHPKRQIDIAAAFQESIDQSVSKSIYIDEQLRNEMREIYLYAWKKKLKSTYYCFIDKVIKGEKYTSKVNKRRNRAGFGNSSSKKEEQKSQTEQVPKSEISSVPGKGFGATAQQSENSRDKLIVEARKKFGDKAVEQALQADENSCPTDPMLRKICPSCE
jgi:ribonucleoside-diphosphate reductase alpha chain